MRAFATVITFLATLTLFGGAASAEDTGTYKVRLDLVDGSCLVGNSTIESLTVTRDTTKIRIPLSDIVKFYTKGNKNKKGQKTAVIVTKKDDLTNKVRGFIDVESIELETIFGNLDVDMVHLRKFRVIRSYTADENVSDGDGTIAFGGVKWHPWRTAFEIQGDKLVSLPKPRAGFNYGHSGNGRGPWLVSNVGNTKWKDYSVRFKVGMPGIDPSFNPYGLEENHNAKFISIKVHVADAKESWNERGLSAYSLQISDKRRVQQYYKWRLQKNYNVFSDRAQGWGNISQEGFEILAESNDGNDLDGLEGTLVRMDVFGNRIQVWIDGDKVADVMDQDMSKPFGGTTLDHGGIAIQTAWEDMFWISDFSMNPL